MNQTAPLLLEVRDLCKVFPKRMRFFSGSEPGLRAVDAVSFSIAAGETLGLVGESGCGKSTVARTILGLYPATSGSVLLDGEELVGRSRRAWLPLRRRVQMVFQDPFASLDPRQTVASILEEPMLIHRLGDAGERRKRVLQLLEWVGLNPKHLRRYPHEFSGGQRQRINIARALALEPELLICDEPVSSLDVSVRAQIVNLLKDLQQQFGLAYLFISHDMSIVRQLCDRVAVMFLGKIVEQAPRDLLFSAPQHPYTKALLSAVPIPDPELERARQRIVLTGELPSASNPPTGCTFHTRCQERHLVEADRCRMEEPVLSRLASGDSRSCRCHRVN